MTAVRSPLPLSRRNTEAFRRQVYVATVAMAGLANLAIMIVDVLNERPFQWPSALGLLLCAVLVPLLLQRRVPLQHIANGALIAATLVVLAELLTAFRGGAVEPRLYFAGVFLFLTAFSVLPLWFAAAYSLALYLAFVALTLLSHGDTTLLAQQALTVFLIAHLSVFGERVSAERAEATTSQLLASTDCLTALANRRAMYPLLDGAFQADIETRQTAVLLLDIDHFKHVNDRHGHQVGDDVLQQFALILQGAVGPEDVVSRWGGEEFLILLPGTAMREAIDRAEHLLRQVRQATMPSSLQITASCGVAHATEVESVEAWLLCVDKRLYVAKGCGRDQVSSLDHCERETA